MGKQGPCTHCGIATTPLWRNGPPEKPVLCNACGSRWRTRGTLEGYMPLHAGGLGLGTSGGGNRGKPKSTKPPIRAPKTKLGGYGGGTDVTLNSGSSGGLKLKRKQQAALPPYLSEETDEDDMDEEGFFGSFAGKSLPKGEYQRSYGEWEPSDEEESDEGLLFANKRYDSGTSKIGRSASTGKLPISGTETLAFPVPSRKRSTTGRPRSGSQALNGSAPSASLLTNDSRSYFSIGNSGSPEEDYDEDDIMVHNMSPMVSVELGLGSLMVRTPSCDTLESYGHIGGGGGLGHFDFSYKEGGGLRAKGSSMHRVPSVSSLRLGEHRARAEPRPNKALLENFPYSKRNVLSSSQSPMVFLNLKDIINCDNFYLLLTAEERVGLLQMLPPIDTVHGQNSVSEMFGSLQFESAVLNFQQLLSEGMFDPSETDHQQGVTQLFQHLKGPSASNLVEAGWWAKWSTLRVEAKGESKQTAAENDAAGGAGSTASSAQFDEKAGGGKAGLGQRREPGKQGLARGLDRKPTGLLEMGGSESDRNSDYEGLHQTRGRSTETIGGGVLGMDVPGCSKSARGTELDHTGLEGGYDGYRGDSTIESGYGLLSGDSGHMGDAASLFLVVPPALPSLCGLDALGTSSSLLQDDSAKLESGGLIMNNNLSMFQDPMWDNPMWDSLCSAPQRVHAGSPAWKPGPR